VTAEARVTVTIEASPKTVFEHLVERDKLLRWMGVSAEFEGEPGTPLTIATNSDNTASGEFLEVVPHERVVFTELTLIHTGLPSEQAYVEHQGGWGHFLGRFVELMATGPNNTNEK